MTTLNIISTIALQRAIEQLAADFTAHSGVELRLECAATGALLTRIRAGERGDVAVLTDEGAAALEADGLLVAGAQPGGVAPLVRSTIGMAVKAGAPHPDISSFEAFMRTLQQAESIVYSQAGASGLFMQDFLVRQGIADQIKDRATVLPAGFTAALVAAGKVQYAFQQISELLSVDGIEIVGQLPAGAQAPSVFSAGAFADSAKPQQARAFLDFMHSKQALPALARYGLEPL